MNKQQLADKIRTAEGFSDEEKSSLLALLRTQKKYGLVWEDKPEEVEARLENELPVLTPKNEGRLDIVSSEPDAPNHVLIEGDNLEALTALAYTHAGKIDVIYIDPPYNTGNRDFVYNDSYVDAEDGYRHSKWLSFMNKRLKIAKLLLSDKGVIFISIDDNEQAQLKLLCDEVFGAGVFIANFIWEKRVNRENRKEVSVRHDYVLCYSKTFSEIRRRIKLLPMNEKALSNYGNPDNDPRGLWKSDPAHAQGGHGTPSQFYTLIAPNGKKHELPSGRCWLYTEPVMKQAIADNRIWFGKDGNGVPRIKTYLNAKERGLTPESILFASDVSTNEKAKNDLKAIFDGKVVFETPKPVGLVYLLEQITSDKSSNILDFFAGSGTTLHATMQLNAEDGGHRKCILVTNNENGICENVTYERNRRVIQGYTTPKGEQVAGLAANSLRYYTTAFVGRERTAKNMRQLVNLSTDMLCIKEDLYAEKKAFGELPTNAKVFRYFDDGRKRMLVIYREEFIEPIVEQIYDLDFDGRIKVYVFSPSEDPLDGLFEGVEDKVELCALPMAIYNAYRRVLPKRRDTFEAEQTETAENNEGAATQATLFDFIEGEEA